MTHTSQPKTAACPAWCNDHQLRHLPDGRLDADYHLHVVDRLGDDVGAVEVYQEADGSVGAYWGAESSADSNHVRRLGRALLTAADTMDAVARLDSRNDERDVADQRSTA